MATSALSPSVQFPSGGRKVAMPEGNHHLMVGGGVEVRKGKQVVQELVEYPQVDEPCCLPEPLATVPQGPRLPSEAAMDVGYPPLHCLPWSE